MVLSYQKLVPCLKFLATYCANEEMYCYKKLEEMKSAKLSRNFGEYKELLNTFYTKLAEIMRIINAYHIDFPTVKQLIHKLSSATIKDRLRSGLEDVKTQDNDIYNTNNYLLTLRQLLNVART